MISKKEKTAIKTILEGSSALLIFEYLNTNAIRNTHGNPYLINYIRDVLNGVRENKILEAHIYDAVAYYKEIYAKRDKHRKSLLKSA